jgi:fatty-acyl-CoA synthase
VNEFKDKTYGQALTILTDRFSDREALIFRGTRFSFSDVRRQCDLAAARLGALGLRPGDKVAIWLPNRPELIWYWLGAAATGLVAVIMNTRLKRDEVAYQLRQSDSRAVIVPGEGAFRDFLADVAVICPEAKTGQPGNLSCAELPLLRHIIVCDQVDRSYGGVHDFSGPPAEDLAVPPYATDPSQPAMIAYSSGTTALPKGAILNHSVWRKVADHGDRFRQTAEDRLYLAVPLFGILASINGVLTFWSRGSGVILEERFEPLNALRVLSAERCTAAYLLPLMVEQIANHPERTKYDLGRLRTGIVVTTDPEILRLAAREIGMREVFTSYGMTETSTAVTRTWWSDPLETRLHSNGKPFPDIDVRVADPETNEVLPAGQSGEIQVKGYCVTPGYYNKPEDTARAFTPDGWFKTGDAGYLLNDGSLKFTARLKDSYKHNGFNVSTTEVESILLQHPAVKAAAMVGLPDRTHGEIGFAFVIPRHETSAEDVMDFLRTRLASFKLPRTILFVEEFPYTAGTGKVQKFQLKELALSYLQTSAPETPHAHLVMP